jgi:ParB family chromosome partitioning protein
MPEYKYIPIDRLIEPPNPIRVSMDEHKLASLAEDIKQNGVLQPPIVIASIELSPPGALNVVPGKYDEFLAAGGKFEIVAGHRRYKAAVMANLNAIPCLVHADREIARHAAMLSENTEREDITPAEEAIFFAELIERYDYTEDQLLKAVKKSASYVYARLDLLRGNQEVFAALREKKISMAVATQLNRCKNAVHCAYLLGLAVTGGATALTVSKWVTDYQVPRGEETATPQTAAVTTEGPAAVVADERACMFCRRSINPLNLVPVWIHDWELREWNERLDNAANVDVAPNTSAQGA